MHHKRKRPKNRRAGCLLCKPHKANGCLPRHLDMRASDRRRFEAEWVNSPRETPNRCSDPREK